VFNFKPDSEDYIEGGQNHLVEKIENVISNIFPRSVTVEQRQNMIRQISPSNQPPEVLLRSDKGDVYSFNTLPSYFGECLDYDDKSKRVLFTLEFTDGIDPRPIEGLSLISQSSPLRDEVSAFRGRFSSPETKTKQLQPQPQPQPQHQLVQVLPQLNDKAQSQQAQQSQLKLAEESKHGDSDMSIDEDEVSPVSHNDKQKHQHMTSVAEISISKMPSKFTPAIGFEVGAIHKGTATHLTEEGLYFVINNSEVLCPMKWAQEIVKDYEATRPFQCELMIWSIDRDTGLVMATCRIPKHSVLSIKKGAVFDGFVSQVDNITSFIDIGCGCYAMLKHVTLNGRRFVPDVGDKLSVTIARFHVTNDMDNSKIHVNLKDAISSKAMQKIQDSQTRYRKHSSEKQDITGSTVQGTVLSVQRHMMHIDVKLSHRAFLSRSNITSNCPDMTLYFQKNDKVTIHLGELYLFHNIKFYKCSLVSPLPPRTRSSSQFMQAKQESLNRQSSRPSSYR